MEVQKSTTGSQPGTTPSLTSPEVLVVDDNQELLGVLHEVLAAQSFRVRSASSAEGAVELLKERIPDIIICDIMMPNVDGFRFHEIIKQSPEWCSVPFIFLSALSDKEEVSFGKALGCDDYLTKPFDPMELAAVIKGKLAVTRIRKERSEEKLEKYRRRIIHTLSHEFRTPLVAINTGTELLRDQHSELEPPRIDRLLDSIQRGGQRLQRLVEDFMTLQQIDSGTAAGVATRLRRRCLLEKIVVTAVECFHETVNGDRLQIDLTAKGTRSPQEIFVEVYDIQIINVIQRVLSNAHKFQGTGKPVVISIQSTEESASVVIRDFGPGMEDELADQACQMFEQIDRDKNEQQGCGLGLTIASYFTSLNGGQIFFRKPVDGEGLEVELRFGVA